MDSEQPPPRRGARSEEDTGQHKPSDADRLEVMDSTVQKTYEWINAVNDALGRGSRQQAYTGLRGVLHALRDRLTVDEAAHFAAQLPMLLRGVYYEGWKPSATPEKSRSLDEFLAQVESHMRGLPVMDPMELVRAVFAIIQQRITHGELEDVRNMLPAETRALWPEEPGQPEPRARLAACLI